KLVPFAELSVAHASVLTILAISLERYIAICRPLRANYTCTKHRAVALCIAIWIIGFVATSPMLAIAQHKTLRYIDRSIHNACLTQAHNFWAQLYFLSSIVIFFFLPLLTLIGLYWVISKNLMSDPSGAGRCCPDHPTMRARRQVVIMLATVVFFFFICLLPFRVFTMYIILAPDSWVESMGQELYYNVLYFCRVMLYLNSSINPVLYNVMSSKFREAFFKVLGCPVGSQRRNQWLCRHLSRQSTFTTSSTLPTSSIKTQHYHHHHGKSCCGNGDSVRIRELTGVGVVIPDQPKNGHFHGKHVRALRATSGPYYPSNQPPPKRQLSTDAAVVHTQVVNVKEKKSMIRANSVV
ncbi:Growth hormone secretagogue receptor type 1, partial [Folsomia candida]